MKIARFVLAGLVVAGLTASSSLAVPFHTGAKDPGSTVKFEVSAPLETIVGTSAALKGHFDFEPNNIKTSKKGRFVMDVAAFKTGIDLRDEHLRDRFLHTGKYPQAIFTLDKVVKASKNKIKSGESVELELEGTLDMHGVKRKEKVSATVTYLAAGSAGGVLPGNVIAIQAKFRVKLADYKIERPEMLMLRVGEEVDIDVTSRLSDKAADMAGSCGCGSCSGSCGGGCGGSCGGSCSGSCGGGCGGSCDGSCGGGCGGSCGY